MTLFKKFDFNLVISEAKPFPKDATDLPDSVKEDPSIQTVEMSYTNIPLADEDVTRLISRLTGLTTDERDHIVAVVSRLYGALKAAELISAKNTVASGLRNIPGMDYEASMLDFLRKAQTGRDDPFRNLKI